MSKENSGKSETPVGRDTQELQLTEWITLEIVVGDITSVEADAVVCSSNGFLLMGSGSAGALREAGGYYNPTADSAARMHAHMAHLPLRLAESSTGFARLERQSVHIATDREGRHYFSDVQTGAFDLLAHNGIDEKTGLYKPYKVGDVVRQPLRLAADKDGTLPRVLYHVIAMTYKLAMVKHKDVAYYVLGDKVPATPNSIDACMHALLAQLQTTSDSTVAIPLIGSNKGGLTATDSARTIVLSLQSSSAEKKLHVKLVLDKEVAQKNPELRTILERAVSSRPNQVGMLIQAIKAKLGG